MVWGQDVAALDRAPCEKRCELGKDIPDPPVRFTNPSFLRLLHKFDTGVLHRQLSSYTFFEQKKRESKSRRPSPKYKRLYFFNEILKQLSGDGPRIPPPVFDDIEDALSMAHPHLSPRDYTCEQIRGVCRSLNVPKLYAQERWVQIWKRCCERLPEPVPTPPVLTPKERRQITAYFLRISRAFDTHLWIPPHCDLSRRKGDTDAAHLARVENFKRLEPEWTQSLRSKNFMSTAAVLGKLLDLLNIRQRFERFLPPLPYTTPFAKETFDIRWDLLAAVAGLTKTPARERRAPEP